MYWWWQLVQLLWIVLTQHFQIEWIILIICSRLNHERLLQLMLVSTCWILNMTYCTLSGLEHGLLPNHTRQFKVIFLTPSIRNGYFFCLLAPTIGWWIELCLLQPSFHSFYLFEGYDRIHVQPSVLIIQNLDVKITKLRIFSSTFLCQYNG